MMTIAIGIYYAYGFLWLLSGVVTGWLRWRGSPGLAAVWIVVNAAIWPWLVCKILYDLAHGREWTELV